MFQSSAISEHSDTYVDTAIRVAGTFENKTRWEVEKYDGTIIIDVYPSTIDCFCFNCVNNFVIVVYLNIYLDSINLNILHIFQIVH